jgi:hypothetical protein
MSVLPKEINYRSAASLPEGTSCNSIVASPINGSAFGPSSIIQFDLVQRGYLVPESMYIRYKLTVTGGTAGARTNFIRGTPVYSFFERSEVIVGSQVVESVQNYHQLCNMLVNCKMNYGQKVGLANSFGYNVDSAAVGDQFNFGLASTTTVSNLANGYNLLAATGAAPLSLFLAAPLGNILSNADHLVPLKFMPSCRVQLTTAALATAIQSPAGANTIANYSISNIELCMDVIEFSPMVDQAISSMGNGAITIRSQSYLSSGVTLPAGSQGSLEFLFNQRLASIKSLYTHLSGTVATVSLNTLFDSVDCTGANGGDYQWFIAGTPYPPRPISTVLNKAGASMELSAAFGPAHDLLTSNFAIHPLEFNAGNTTVTTQNLCGKFILGTNVEKLSTNGVLLTGISSQGSPISFRVSIGTATTNAQVIQLICLYDALLQIDIPSRTLTVMQ